MERASWPPYWWMTPWTFIRVHTRVHMRAAPLFSCIAVIVHVYAYTRFIGPDRSLELLKRAGERGGHALCFTTIFLSSFLRSCSFGGVFFSPPCFSFVVSGVHGAAYIRNTLRETRDGAEYLEFNDPRWERSRCAVDIRSMKLIPRRLLLV